MKIMALFLIGMLMFTFTFSFNFNRPSAIIPQRTFNFPQFTFQPGLLIPRADVLESTFHPSINLNIDLFRIFK